MIIHKLGFERVQIRIKDKLFYILYKSSIQSNLCTTATLGTPKKRPLLIGGRYSKGPSIKLLWIWDVWGSGWPLLTGGRYSEVAVSTGLTVLLLKYNFYNITFIIYNLYNIIFII